jgi:anaerobic magnesium-protoporphyrin IX monomethyl ester cyclase
MKKRIALVTPPSHSHRTAEENLGIGYLAAVLRSQGRPVTLVDAWLSDLTAGEAVRRVLQHGDVGLIGISCYISERSDVAELIRGLRTSGYSGPVVAGGYGPTFHGAEFLSLGCDYVLQGEAERSLPAFVEALEAGSGLGDIPGLLYLKDGLLSGNPKAEPTGDLDSLPFPARDTIQRTIALKNPVHVSTSRGCTAHCLFCSVISFDRSMKSGPRWRSRSVRGIADEIERLHAEYGATCFKFVDDSFIEPPRDTAWAQEFAAELERRDLSISFRTQVRADRITSDLAAALVRAGWFATSVGIENASPSALARMNKSADLEDNLRALAILEAHGVYVQMGMILFDHATTMEELHENHEFLRLQKWPVTKGIFTEMFAAAGTPYARFLKREGRLADAALGNYRYARSSEPVEQVYRALKAWHKSHAAVYDRAMNPLSAPKALPKEGYAEYHRICRDLCDGDVRFLGELLECAERSDTDPDDLTRERIASSSGMYAGAQRKLDALDLKYGLEYRAGKNEFLE